MADVWCAAHEEPQGYGKHDRSKVVSAPDCVITFTTFPESKNQRAGCVGVVFLVVRLGIQAFAQDVKFKLFMPRIRSRYLR
jgi:hypothetical protein